MTEGIRWLFTSEMSFSTGRPITGPPILFLVLLGLWIFSAFRVARDARKRGRSVFLAIVLVHFVGWPFSILWWIWLRPALPPKLPNSG